MRRLATGLAVGLMLGYAAGSTAATPWSAPDLPAASQGFGAPAQAQTGAPQGTPTRSAVPPVELSPAAELDSPSPSVGASVPGASASVAVIATGTPGPGRTLSGVSSWYCLAGRSVCTRGYPASGLYAAAGPRLRSALGPGWRGTAVTIAANGLSARVKLIDVCQCYDGMVKERVIDLYASVWAALGVPLSRGLVKVTVAW